MPFTSSDPAARFDALHMPEPNSGCWLWLGEIFSEAKPYGRFTVAQRRKVRAHRYSFERSYGAIPAGLIVCHRCDNPTCVNPQHLFLGTYEDNNLDASRKGRLNPHCRRLSHAEAAQIRREYRKGTTDFGQVALSKRYGVTPSSIANIISNVTYRQN